MNRQAPEFITSPDYQLLGPLHQRQMRLTGAHVGEMAAKYEAGATVYELAAEFGCHRTTVAERLKKAGIVMRLQTPEAVAINSMESLYQSGLSCPEIGRQLGYSANSVRKYLWEVTINY